MTKTLEQVSKDTENLARLVRSRVALRNPFPASRDEPYERGLQTNKITPPQGMLQIFGGIVIPSTTLTLVNGANQDIALGFYTYARIAGPTLAFSLGGFTGGIDGRILLLFNPTTQAMTISNQAAGSAAANRISTFKSADVVLAGDSYAIFQYDAGLTTWLLLIARDSTGPH